jgi:hypothetical protein
VNDLSYDLVFWQCDDREMDPRSVYEALMDGQAVQGLRDLLIEEIVARILAIFPDTVRPNGANDRIVWIAPDEISSFQAEWSDVHLAVTLRPLSHHIANQLIDLLGEFDCPMYDPQINERFVLGS